MPIGEYWDWLARVFRRCLGRAAVQWFSVNAVHDDWATLSIDNLLHEIKVFHLHSPVCDMVLMQMFTGMRSTELCIMRPEDITEKGDVTLYKPSKYKGMDLSSYGKRIVPIGERGQAILKKHKGGEYFFVPPNGNGCYTKYGYRRAVVRAVEKFNKEHKNVQMPHITPHAIRHDTISVILCTSLYHLWYPLP